MIEKANTIDPVLIDVPMPIVTPRLVLDAIRPGDGKELCEAKLETWDELHPWMPWAHGKKKDVTEEESETVARQKHADFILRKELMMVGREKETGKAVIFSGFNELEWRLRQIQIGYWVRKSAHGKGYAVEAANALLRYAFAALPVSVVSIRHAEGNQYSRAVIERLGFQYVGNEVLTYETPQGHLMGSCLYRRTSIEGLPPLDVSWGEGA